MFIQTEEQHKDGRNKHLRKEPSPSRRRNIPIPNWAAQIFPSLNRPQICLCRNVPPRIFRLDKKLGYPTELREPSLVHSMAFIEARLRLPKVLSLFGSFNALPLRCSCVAKKCEEPSNTAASRAIQTNILTLKAGET